MIANVDNMQEKEESETVFKIPALDVYDKERQGMFLLSLH
jgi:hypothetical protein